MIKNSLFAKTESPTDFFAQNSIQTRRRAKRGEPFKTCEFLSGAAGRTRTDTGFLPLDLKSSAYANFATAAKFYFNESKNFRPAPLFKNFSLARASL